MMKGAVCSYSSSSSDRPLPSFLPDPSSDDNAFMAANNARNIPGHAVHPPMHPHPIVPLQCNAFPSFALSPLPMGKWGCGGVVRFLKCMFCCCCLFSLISSLLVFVWLLLLSHA